MQRYLKKEEWPVFHLFVPFTGGEGRECALGVRGVGSGPQYPVGPRRKSHGEAEERPRTSQAWAPALRPCTTAGEAAWTDIY